MQVRVSLVIRLSNPRSNYLIMRVDTSDFLSLPPRPEVNADEGNDGTIDKAFETCNDSDICN